MTALAALAFLIWCGLLLARGRFWRAGRELPIARPESAPEVVIVIPARDEAALIGGAVRSLLNQTYPGAFRVIVVDDGSEDGTGAIARRIADPRLTVIDGKPRPAGWAGKLWAVSQGIAAAGAPEFVLLTDADIVHDAPHLASLVACAERDDLDLVSEMVILSCDSFAERALVPAFVYFFRLLYPFAWVNDPARGTAAAAGGTILLRRRALARIGGIEAVRGALIDDVALAGAIKTGGRIYLGQSGQARSIRPCPGVADIWRMVARSAYAQLRFSRVVLACTTLGMALVWLVPPVAALSGHGTARLLGFVTWTMLAASFLPTLARYGRSYLWAVVLPAIALFYMAATIGSALYHHRGRGVVWKGRAYAGGAP